MTAVINDVIEGDCLEGMKLLADGSVDLVFADPPFNIGYHYDVYRDNLEDNEYLGWTRQWMEQVIRILKDDGSFWLAIGDEYAAEMKVLMQRTLGLTCRSWVIWYYTFGVNCQKKFNRSHAHLFQMVKDPGNFTFNADATRVPSARQLQDLPEGFQADDDTWYFPRVAGTFKERSGFHGCQMPEQLLGRIIRVSSNEGELVLDPFAGSGTTLAVACKLRRQYLGYEISTDYVEAIRKRLDSIKPGDKLDGAAEPLVSAPSTDKGRRLKA